MDIQLENSSNEKILLPIIWKFDDLINHNDFVVDKTGVKIVELLGEKIVLNPEQKTFDLIAKKTNIDYVKKELEWYDSQDLKIIDIAKVAKLWYHVSNDDGYINSNYGWIIYSKNNYSQYQNCLNELIKNKESRRAIMIYQRPNIWEDAFKNGGNDFICTDGVQCFIRNDKLIYIIKQRSCDFIYGFFNDYYWHSVVYERLFNDLKKHYQMLKTGVIMYFPFSLHVYEKHFKLINSIITKYMEE